MRLVRASWFVFAAAIIVAAAVPTLRHQFRLSLSGFVPRRQVMEDPWSVTTAMLKPYRERAAAFVEERYPDDPEMLLAAGQLAGNVDLLRRAAEEGGGPIAWAAYAEAVTERGPGFMRIGNTGADPADPVEMESARRTVAESGVPDRLTPEQAEPVLSVLRSWQEADPDNALPVALEARYLYGLHEDRDALIAWSQAGRMPVVTSHALARAGAVERLLAAMGMPEPDAIMNSQLSMVFPFFATARDTARFAVYEGRVAAMEGDPIEAITWWQSTADFGRHMQESADTIIGFLVGVAVQGIGGHPIWQWTLDERSGIPNGPLFGGRYFWGDQHSLYVEHMGPEADRELRDSLVRAKVRSSLSREYTKDLGAFESYFRANRYPAFAAIVFALAALLLAAFAAFGTWSRRAADEATRLRPTWQVIIALLVVLPAAVSGLVVLRRDFAGVAMSATLAAQLILGFVGVPLLLLVLLPLFAAISSRRSGARLRTAWRGNLRRVIPVAIAVAAVLSLWLSAYAADLRAQWAEKWSAPGVTEFSDMVEKLGPAWTDPTIPPDAWRAEYPPGRTEA